MQRACAVLYCHLWPVMTTILFQPISLYHNFLHYLRNGTIFGNKLLNIKCVFLFSVQLLSEIFLILRRIQRDIIINLHTSSRKYPLILSDFNKTWILLTDFRKTLKYQNSWQSVQWEPSCSMRTDDGRTDKTKVIVAFRNLCKSLKMPNIHS